MNYQERKAIQDRMVKSLKPATIEQVIDASVFQYDPFPVGSAFQLEPLVVDKAHLTYTVSNRSGRYNDHDGGAENNFQVSYKSSIAGQVVVAEGLRSTPQVWDAIIDNIQQMEG
tara:strand:+ start:760 stop:1101 length:342 start_codon:yes stop_codon:yes gene_type:complete